MVAVAVGALHEDIVRAVKELRIADDGLVDVSDIAGEDDHARLAALVRGDADAGRAEQVARVDELRRDALTQLHRLAVFARLNELLHALGVLDGVERLDRRTAARRFLRFWYSASDS